MNDDQQNPYRASPIEQDKISGQKVVAIVLCVGVALMLVSLFGLRLFLAQKARADAARREEIKARLAAEAIQQQIEASDQNAP